jgi:hypothetical protein
MAKVVKVACSLQKGGLGHEKIGIGGGLGSVSIHSVYSAGAGSDGIQNGLCSTPSGMGAGCGKIRPDRCPENEQPV